MVPRTRVLIGCGAAALAWMLGYGMGGGLRIGGKGTAGSRDGAAAHGHGAAAEQAGSRNGIARTADDTLAEQIAGRRNPWTRERLQSSLNAIAHEPDILHVVRFAMKLADQLGPEDFPLAIEVAKDAVEGRDEEGQIYRALALMRWAELKPGAAAEYLKAQHKLDGSILSDREVLLGVWGASDPAAAVAWAKTLPEKDKQQEAMKDILKAAARRDADAAISLARAHAPELLADGSLGSAIDDALGKRDPERNARTIASLGNPAHIQSAARQWAEKDPDAATRWAQELPDEKLRAEAMKGIWQEFAAKHPEESAAQLSKTPADAPFVEGASQGVVRRLAEKNPQQAALWAGTLQQPGARREAFIALGEFYGNKDAAAGGQWLTSLPEGAERDSAIKGFVQRARGSHAQEAVEWATAIQENQSRRSVLRETLGYWLQQDLPTAFKWLQNSPGISEEDRQAILKKR